MDTIGYILRSFPRLSQTFILNEVLALEERGVRLRLFPAIDPQEPVVQPQVAEVRAPVRYLSTTDEAELQAAHAWLAHHAPERYAAARDYVRRRSDLDEGYVAASRFYCFDQAVLLAEQLHLAGDIGHLHAHFAHDPTLVALLAQQLTGVSFSFTAHARDLFQIPRHILVERAAAATAIVTCCGANLDYLDEALPPELRGKVHLIHHGVNLDGFQPAPRPAPAPDEAPLILSVGRLVEKKGFPDLLRAVALLRGSGRRLRLAIYGDGPLRDELTELAARLGIADCFELPGERPQRELVPVLQSADIFALTPFVTDDGDRDGVPNVLAEAMACGLPVVSTAVAGIPELVHHGENGLLCAARDVETIAAELGRLLDNPEERLRFGAAARRTVVEHFDLRTAAGRLAGLFAQAITSSERVTEP